MYFTKICSLKTCKTVRVERVKQNTALLKSAAPDGRNFAPSYRTCHCRRRPGRTTVSKYLTPSQFIPTHEVNFSESERCSNNVTSLRLPAISLALPIVVQGRALTSLKVES